MRISLKFHRSLSALLAVAIGVCAATAQATPFAYMTLQTANSVAVVDTLTRQIVTTIPVGDGPFPVAVNANGNRVYVVNLFSDNVSVIDTTSNTVIATVGVGDNPYGAALNPAGTRAYVSNSGSHSVSVIDTANNSVLTTVPVGNNPGGVVVNAAGTRLYVANGGGNSVSVLDTANNTVIATIPSAGISPWGLTLSPDGTRLYTANFSGANVSVIDTTSNTVMTAVAVGNSPVGIVTDAGRGLVYAVNRDSNSMSVIDIASNAVVGTVPVGVRPHGVGLHPNGVEIYIANASSSSISVVNANTLTLITTIPMPSLPGSFGTFFAGPLATAPDAPSIGAATPGNAEALIGFTAPGSNGGAAISGYTVTCQPGTISATGTASPITVTGLSNGTHYSCSVIASNVVGNSSPSASVNVTPATTPDAPLLQSATPLDGAARIGFVAPVDNGGSTVLDYTAHCDPGAHAVTADASPIDVIGLGNNTVYRCRVVARNGVGDSPASTELSVIPGNTGNSTDVSITKDNEAGFVNGGDYVDYRIIVTNHGPAAVAGARVEDALAPDFSAAQWTCTPSAGAVCTASGSGALDMQVDLPSGASVEIIFGALPIAGTETPISNIASVTVPSPINDTLTSNNIASDGPDIRGIFRDEFE
jgi:YVTN family beta-propeller protein